VFHDEVRLPSFSRAGVKESPDIGMIEAGQNLSFVMEMPKHRIRVHAAFDELDGNTLPVTFVGALGQVHRTHASAAELAQHPICSDQLPARNSRAISVDFVAGNKKADLINETPGANVRIKQRLNFSSQLVVTVASRVHEIRPFSYW